MVAKHTHSKYGIVDGGGDMAMWSNGDKTWKIGVMDPFDEEKHIGFFIKNGGIATSNIIYRSWMQGESKNIIFWMEEPECLQLQI
ncbi:hypothetical protein [Neobacillus sp. FSL H8-0543]|uniref:hypothetical protein n=1 Tax=Neobacillus sp. FSL H8-0543 TaxID=2954672 RepID=UPI00315955B8